MKIFDTRSLIIVFILLTAASTSACFAQPCTKLDAFRWMLGDWVARGRTYTTYESWTQVSAGTYEGSGRVVSTETGKERSTEAIRLVEMSGEIYMLPKAEDNALPIAFKLVHCNEREALFENKDHDFPTRLTYQHIEGDSLYVHVSDGGEEGFVLRFGKHSK